MIPLSPTVTALIEEMAALIKRRSTEPCDCTAYELRGDVASCCTACEARDLVARLAARMAQARADGLT